MTTDSTWTRLRKAAGSHAVKVFFHSATELAKLAPLSRCWQESVSVSRDLPYQDTGHREHLLDLVRPKDLAGPLPVLFYVHGGGFRMLSKDTHWMMTAGFARMGLLVVAINYRLAPKHVFPAALEDTFAAWLWTLREIQKHGGDPHRILVAGESAGAHLITALTVATCWRRPEAFASPLFGQRPLAALPACGIFQLSQINRLTQHLHPFVADRLCVVAEEFLPAAAGGAEGDFGLADPLLLLEGEEASELDLPPFFLPVGSKDPLLEDTRRLTAALRRRGVRVESPVYANGGHAFHAAIWRPQAQRCWRDQGIFVRSMLAEADQPVC